MKLLLLKVGKWFLHIPVLFAHFPGPAIMLSLVVAIAAASSSAWLTNKINAGTLAEVKIELAECRADHAEAVAENATKRVAVISSATAQQRAIDAENQRAWLEQLRVLADTLPDKAELAKIGRSIEELHRDPAFDCRRLPLPQSYLDGVSLPAETPGSAAGRP